MSKKNDNSKYVYQGLETNGFFLKGSLPKEKAIELAGSDFSFQQVEDNRVGCALMVVRIENMKPWNLPLVNIKYPEAAWLLDKGNGDYLAVKAQTPRSMLWILSMSDNYNTDVGDMSLSKNGENANIIVTSGENRFTVELDGSSENTKFDKTLINNLWTRNKKGKYYRIPWAPNEAESIYQMNCQITDDSLGKNVFGHEVIWNEKAIYFINRPHHCAPSYSDQPFSVQ
ncbi:hypothetical protein [Bacillus solimangrovi]|uniref:Uncharacterized protein n=1 Tax=Bacillus solimangrovi TaxID=1305675 RepID=A0A1E5LBV5_9BACI|nr:hypothetical protein [Bacillus solimangrovi]OEH91566.1 hypothetical protein BFG57_04110 [Bacillus solimangrovi]